MAWEVEYTDQFGDWFGELTDSQQNAVVAAVDALEERGSGLGRPFVDTIKTSRYSNMKELRPMTENLQVLFAFDPHRMAIPLTDGDKTPR